MAHTFFLPNMPVDVPSVGARSPMVESLAPGSDHWSTDADAYDDPARAAKGDLSFNTMPAVRSLTHDGVPFALDPKS